MQKVKDLEDEIDGLRKELRKSHMERIARNECSASKGIIFLDIISNMERVSDHARNIVEYISSEMALMLLQRLNKKQIFLFIHRV